MSKVNQSLVSSVNKLLRAVEIKVLAYSEIKDQLKEISPIIAESMDSQRAFHDNTLDIICVDDDYLQDSTELVLHELVHMALSSSRLNVRFNNTREDRDTEDAAAQMGILSVLAALNINPASYENILVDYVKTLHYANLDRADRLAQVATNYLIGFLVK